MRWPQTELDLDLIAEAIGAYRLVAGEEVPNRSRAIEYAAAEVAARLQKRRR